MEISPYLAAAVLKLDELGETDDWTTFAYAGNSPRNYNAMRHLKKRGWIEDVHELPRQNWMRANPHSSTRPIEEFPFCWQLTSSGREVAAMIKRSRPS